MFVVTHTFLPQAPLVSVLSSESNSLLNKALQICYAAQKGNLPLPEALQKLDSSLPDYSFGNDLLASIAMFVYQTKGWTYSEFAIKEAEEQGWSGDRVYLITHPKTGETRLIIKVFPENSKNLCNEVFSLFYLNQHYSDVFEVPSLQSLGKCRVQNGQHYLLSESAAPGKSLRSYCHEMSKFPPGDDMRQALFEEFRQGTQAAGKSLAQLHKVKLQASHSFPTSLVQLYRTQLFQAVEKLNRHPEGKTLAAKVQQRFDELFHRIKEDPFFTSLTHGDAKLLHAYYHSSSKKITWIDSPHFAYSVDAQDNPIGVAARDWTHFIDDVEQRQFEYYVDENGKTKVRELLTSQEVYLLIEAFKSGYTDGGMPLPTTHQRRFLLLTKHLYILAHYLYPEGFYIQPEPARTALNDRVEKILEELKKS